MYRALKRLLVIFALLVFPVIVYADYMRVTLLGTGSPRPDAHRAGPAVLVEVGGEFLIFDTGRGVVQRLKQLDIPLSKTDKVFITHLHVDHISALDDLWLTSWLYQRRQPLKVYGPNGTQDFTQKLQQAYTYDVSIRRQNTGLNRNAAKLIANEITPGVVYSEYGIKVTAFLVDHAPVNPAYGYRIDFGDRSAVISGDTTYSSNLVAHAQNADVLIHEIFAVEPNILARNRRLQKVERYHTNPAQVLRMLRETKPKVALLTHVILIGIEGDALLKEIKNNYAGEIYIGEDLMRVEVGSDIKVVPFGKP